MTMNTELDIDSVEVKQHVKCPVQNSFHSKLTVRTLTHHDCSTWSNKSSEPAAKYKSNSSALDKSNLL